MRPATVEVIIVTKMQRTVLGLFLAFLAAPAVAVAQPAAANSGEAGYYFLLGRSYESAGDIDKAIAAQKQAIALAPGSAELRAELAGLYARQDRALDAIGMAEEALKFDQDNAEANRILGSIYAAYAEQQRPLRPGDSPQLYVARAVAALERAKAAGANDLNVDLTLGRLYLRASAYDKAIPLLRRVAGEQPGYTEIAILLASAQEGAGRTAEAIETLRGALAENPRALRGFILLAELSE